MIIIDKKTISGYLSEYITSISVKEINNLVEIPPPDFDFNYAFPCFHLAKFEKKAPNVIANELETKMRLPDYLEVIEATGPYLNFRVKPQQILQNVFTLQEDYGRIYEKISKITSKSSRIVIEYPSPNTNKPLHFGHIRNILLSRSLSNLLKYKGDLVFDVNLNNDRGIHICKSMFAYKKWGDGKEPDKKSDHFVGDFYVKYTQMEQKDSKIIENVYDLLRLWEEDDPQTRAL